MERYLAHLPLHERTSAVNVFWTLANHVFQPAVCARTPVLPLPDYRYVLLAAQERGVLFSALEALALVHVAQGRKIAAQVLRLPAVRTLVVQPAARNIVAVLPADKTCLLHAQRASVYRVVSPARLASLHLVEVAVDGSAARVGCFRLGTTHVSIKPRERVLVLRRLRLVTRQTLVRRLFVRLAELVVAQ